MCGICGVFNYRNEKKIELDILNDMLNAIRHRGPDGSRSFINGELALGFCRLSFIDLEGGMQPLYNEDKTITLICNGEVFNYTELRDELIREGHIFSTHTDVEVIIHLYEEYGLDFIHKLNGQFSIALYDGKKKRLILVRDPMGITPLFYTLFDGRLIFASEIKAILEYPGMPRKLNIETVDQLLTFPGPISPNTFFENIYSLENGHMLLIENNNIKNIEYWDVYYDRENEDLGELFYVENLRERLIKSVSQRLIADVPIGFYISGGLDSSIVASYIHKYIPGQYSSFSAEFPDEKFTEKGYQTIVKELVQTNHFSVMVKEEDLWEQMRNVLYYTETPLKETYDVAAYLLSGLVQESSTKAILTGQGADEFFNGYIGYKYDFIRARQRDKTSKEECEINERLWGDPYFQYEKEYGKYEKEKYKLYSNDLKGEASKFSAINKSPINISRVQNLKSQRLRSYIDYKLRLVDHLLADHGDRMCFAHSIEGRHPFLDKDVIEFTLKMPEKYKLCGSNEKYILKQAAKGIVPDSIIHRRKSPFRAPGMPEMLKQNVALVEIFMSDEILKKQGIFDVDYIHSLKRRYVEDNFKLNIPYDCDYLVIVLTVTMFNEIFNVGL